MRALVGLNGFNMQGCPSTPWLVHPGCPAEFSSGQPVLGELWPRCACPQPCLSLLCDFMPNVQAPCLLRYAVTWFQACLWTCLLLLLTRPHELYFMNWASDLFFFIFPSLEVLLDPVSSSWLWSEPVGHGICWGHWLMANFPLGNGFTALVYASRLKVYTKLILKRCSYHLFGQTLILFGLLHFYSPNNFPFNIIDISPFTVGIYWQITSRLTQYNIK